MKRRDLLKAVGTASVVGSVVGARVARAMNCTVGPTPHQSEGPFYPEDWSVESDADLTWIEGSQERAKGKLVDLRGRVFGSDCLPVAGALVEIWQACVSGAYNHSQDPNGGWRDPNFQYWGRVFTSQSGAYSFKTIKPGAYPASPTWLRPAHIHFKIIVPGVPTLTTQMYFAGDSELDDDLVLARLTPEQRKAVIVPFVDGPEGLVGRFDIRLSETPALD